MKTLVSMLMLLLMAVVATAQTPAKVEKEVVANCSIDPGGNYIAVSHAVAEIEPTETKQTYTDNKGVVYPVWLNPKGKPFVYKVSRNTGNKYKFYLVTEHDQVHKPLIQ